MRIAKQRSLRGAISCWRCSCSWLLLLFLWCAACSSSSFASNSMAAAKAEAEADAEATTTNSNNNNIIVDEDELVQETIAAGRGDRDEQGVRDQWLSDEHIGKESTFDSRMPISEDVARLLRAYRLTCEGCDHTQAVRKVNAFVRETKRLAKDEEKKDGGVWAATNKFVVALVVAALSAAYVYRKGELGFLDVLLYQNNNNSRGGDDLGGFSEAQKANILRLRRQHAADAASKRQQRQTTQPPTWLENEQKEVWTPKQEKQFQKASREFSGVPKKERYKLIAEKVVGKSRIECLTHHRMQELLAKQKEQQQL